MDLALDLDLLLQALPSPFVSPLQNLHPFSCFEIAENGRRYKMETENLWRERKKILQLRCDDLIVYMTMMLIEV